MIKEQDNTDKITNKKIMKSGALKQAEELYNDFLKYLEEEDLTLTKSGTNVISFQPFRIESQSKNLPMKLAAKADELPVSNRLKLSFYSNDDNNVILKINIKNGNQVYATAIAEAGTNINDGILYCRESDKYFISGNKNEFFIGVNDNFDLSKFNFDLVTPVNRLIIFKSEDSYSHFAQSDNIDIESTVFNNDGIKIILKPNTKISTVVIKTGSYKDFINIKNNIILVPPAFCGGKLELVIY